MVQSDFNPKSPFWKINVLVRIFRREAIGRGLYEYTTLPKTDHSKNKSVTLNHFVINLNQDLRQTVLPQLSLPEAKEIENQNRKAPETLNQSGHR